MDRKHANFPSDCRDRKSRILQLPKHDEKPCNVLNKLRSRKNYSLIPVFVWLFIQLLMTGILSPASASISTDGSGPEFSNEIVICTFSGLTSVSINDQGSKPDSDPREGQHCDWCLLFGNHAPVLGQPVWLDVTPDLETDIQRASVNETRAEQNETNGVHCRAPPVFTQSIN